MTVAAKQGIVRHAGIAAPVLRVRIGTGRENTG